MKRMRLTIVLLIVTFGFVFCQPDKTFKEVVTFEKGFKIGDNNEIQLEPYLGSVSSQVEWADVLNKPDFAVVATSGEYEDLLNKPDTLRLEEALPQLRGIAFPVLTQADIDVLVPSKGLVLINSTNNCMQWYDGSVWKIFITGN